MTNVVRSNTGPVRVTQEARGVIRDGGRDGRTVLNGVGKPGAKDGKNGDFYIDTGAWKIYGPKSSGAWGDGASLIAGGGENQGPPGADGKTVRNGADVPNPDLGSNGDFYINTSNWHIYGPKTSGSWGAGVSLVGPAGQDGEDGEDGAAGPSGPGPLLGAGAPSGGTGNDGDTYLDTTTGDLYGPKTSGSWGASIGNLKGPPGDQGDPGQVAVFEGVWDNATDYDPGSVVSWDGNGWGASQWTPAGNEPGNDGGDYWYLIVEGGGGGGGGDTSTPFRPADVDNGWNDNSADNDPLFPCGYYRRGDRVFLRGMAEADDTRTGNIIFTLDEGFRPASTEAFIAGVSYTGSGETVTTVLVQPTGEVVAGTSDDPYPDTTVAFLSNVSFQVAA